MSTTKSLPSTMISPPLKGAPQRPPAEDEWTIEILKDHLHAGMHIELSTIPIYLCAMYSIKKDNGGGGTTARVKILDVAQQEMLHLTLVGNMYCAVGGTKKLYDPDFIMKYPSHMLYQDVQLELAAATKKNLENFLKIEAPYMRMPNQAPPGINPLENNTDQFLEKYRSIGQFYEELEKGIKILTAKDGDLFKKRRGTQFTNTEFFQTEQCGIIEDLKSALAALELIVDEGEGGVGVEDSHYKVFVDLHEQRKNWEHLDLIDEPSSAKYEEQGQMMLYYLSQAFNAAYCYLLVTIDTCWETEAPPTRIQLIRNIHAVMIEAITPLAELIMKQQVDGKCAAPCFEYYPLDSSTSALQGLFDGMKKELENAQEQATDQATKLAISQIQFNINRVPPPK